MQLSRVSILTTQSASISQRPHETPNEPVDGVRSVGEQRSALSDRVAQNEICHVEPRAPPLHVLRPQQNSGEARAQIVCCFRHTSECAGGTTSACQFQPTRPGSRVGRKREREEAKAAEVEEHLQRMERKSQDKLCPEYLFLGRTQESAATRTKTRVHTRRTTRLEFPARLRSAFCQRSSATE